MISFLKIIFMWYVVLKRIWDGLDLFYSVFKIWFMWYVFLFVKTYLSSTCKQRINIQLIQLYSLSYKSCPNRMSPLEAPVCTAQWSCILFESPINQTGSKGVDRVDDSYIVACCSEQWMGDKVVNMAIWWKITSNLGHGEILCCAIYNCPYYLLVKHYEVIEDNCLKLMECIFL